MRLTLLVPELIWPEPGDKFTLGKLPTPGFEWLDGRAAFQRQPRQPYEVALAGLFGLDDAPFGALRLLGEATEPPELAGHWLCADPVHLRFHHERIVLADAGAFELQEAEAAAIVTSLNAEFADVGIFYISNPRRWYLKLNSTVDQKFAPISQMAGRRLDGELTDKNGPLTRWLNEVQMYLHGHPVNQQREATGQPTVNSLWLWGGGPLPEKATSPYATVWSDNPLATGLARAAGIASRPLPASLHEFLGQASDSHHLIVFDQLLGPVLYENGDDWRSAWQTLDSQWFEPASSALGRQIEALDIVAPTIYGQLGWTLNGSDRWKFWRKGRPLATLAQQLAEGNPS